jgi:hypothetical protein
LMIHRNLEVVRSEASLEGLTALFILIHLCLLSNGDFTVDDKKARSGAKWGVEAKFDLVGSVSLLERGV